MKRFRFIVILILLILVSKIVFSLNFFSNIEHKAQDSLFRIRGQRPTTGDIVIIAIDDASFQALDLSWPFPRQYHAKLIENLNRAGVRQIVFDIEFIDNSSPEADLMLAETASRYGNVIFAGKVLKSQYDPKHVQMLAPIIPIQSRDLVWGIVNMAVDQDGFIRNYNCFEYFDKAPLYSIGIASIGNSRVYQKEWANHVELKSGHLRVSGKEIPLFAGNKSMINYYGPAYTFPHVSYSSVLDDEEVDMPGYMGAELNEFYDLVESGVLKDKIVLIGATIDELHDQFHTPFSSSYTAGVEIHANFIEMVKQEDFLKALDPWLYLLIEFVALLLLWVVFKHLKPQFSAVLLLLLIIGQYVLAYLLFTRSNLLIPVVQTTLVLILIYVINLINHYIATQKEKRFIRNAFQQYMAPELVKELLDNPKNLTYGGSLQEVTVLFSDIRSFTTYSENHKPEQTVQILKEYLTAMVTIIINNRGILDKFVGDEIMALFGTPIRLDNHALAACKVALEMRECMTALHEKWRSEGREIFEIGIGVNTGLAVVGNLGSEQIFDYTAIGDTINLGARLEAINKEYETQNKIIISEFTLEKVSDSVEVRYLDEVKVKGKNKAVKIYELIRIL